MLLSQKDWSNEIMLIYLYEKYENKNILYYCTFSV